MYSVLLHDGPFSGRIVSVPTVNHHSFYFYCPVKQYWYFYVLAEHQKKSFTEEEKATVARTTKRSKVAVRKSEATYNWYNARPDKTTRRYAYLQQFGPADFQPWPNDDPYVLIFLTAMKRDFGIEPTHFHLR